MSSGLADDLAALNERYRAAGGSATAAAWSGAAARAAGVRLGADDALARRIADAVTVQIEAIRAAAGPESATDGARAIEAATAALLALFGDGTDDPGVLPGPAPDDPRALADWWSQRTPAERDALVQQDPAFGNRAGLPAEDKDRINRDYLDRLRQAAEQAVARAAGEHPDWARGENVPRPPDAGLPDEDTQARIREYDRWRAEFAGRGGDTAVDRLRDYAALTGELAGPGRYLLEVDDAGRAAVALGDPDTATHVATYVPGMNSDVDRIGAGIGRSQAMLDAAERAGARDTAVIAWYGYRAPRGPVEAARDAAADAGAPRLDRFQDGLRASHTGPPSRNTVVGHSYGSFVAGTAASNGGSLAVDALVFVGSPGVEVDRVDELRLDGVDPGDNAERVYATAAAHDPVPVVGPLAHGTSVTSDEFGATVFESAPGGPLHAHSQYWDRDNPALATMGRIIAGAARVS